MRFALTLGVFGLTLTAAVAQEPTSPPAKADYSELSRLIRDAVLKSAPKEFSAAPAWGLSRPFPAKLRLPNLQRTTIKKGDTVELAHGSWKRGKAWMDDPQRDFELAVANLTAIEPAKYRVSITSAAPLNVDYEFQQWLNGLMILAVNGRAKTRVKVDLECDVALSLDASKFPPDVTVSPKIADMKVEIQDLKVLNPGDLPRQETVQNINEQLRGFVQSMVRAAEPRIQEQANAAIADAIRQGKGRFSAAKLLEVSKGAAK
jgi:hypothetical protein